MKKRIVCILMSALILINALNLAFIVKPSFAKNVVPSENPLEKTDITPSSKTTDKLNQAERFDDAQPNVSKEKPKVDEPSRDSDDKWNFNDTNEWSNFAYKDGNKTRLIVGVNGQQSTSLPKLEKIVAEHQAKIVNIVSIGGKVRAVVVELLLTSVTPFVEEVRVGGLASYIEPNMKVQAQFVPNDPYWSWQWGPQKIEADWAWNTTVGDPSVLVAVVDTGIYYYHEDIAANYAPLGYDWVNMDPDPLDDHGHGTHCAGIIAAVLNNGIGIAGLAQVRVMAEKVLDSGGYGSWDWVANGIINATDCGADIISMSLGGYGESELVHEAVKYAYDAGVLVIAAAGNDNTNMKLYPAGYDEVVAVAATDQYDYKAWWSNWGDWIELAAPGVDIYSTVPWGYEYASGTSMATPHVSGVAALVWSLYPDKTRDWVRLWLRYTADDLGDPGFDVYYGYGRVNARKAVEQTPPVHDLIAFEWRTPPYVKPGALAIINATILNFGEDDETDVMVQLLANDTTADSTMIDFLASGDSTTVNLLWNPTAERLYNVTLYVVPVPGETSVENNVLQKYIYVGFPVKAVVLHSAGNVYGEIITNWQALTNEWYLFGDTMVYIDYTTLNKEGITYEDIVATEADVLIISCAYDPYAGWQFTDSEIEAITQYVHEGHGLIATAGTLYSMVPNNNKLAPLFGLSETTMWTATGTDLLHLLNTTHPIFTNVPNPLVFPQVVTVLPYDGHWDSNELVGGKYLALGHYQESAVVAYRGLVYISPWLEVIPPYYHHHLQLLYNAITWSRYQKPEHELVVSMETPKRLNPSESTLLNATVFNRGRNNETNVELQLLIDGVLVASVTIPELLVDSSYTLSYLWTPTVQGMYNVTAYAPPVSGEEFTENNIAKKSVIVLLIAVRNVLVYTDDYAVAPSSRYVIVALNNLGINYTHYADDPWGFGAALVSQPWDIVIVDHCNYYAMGNYWTELDEYVRNGGLLVLSTFDIDGSHSEPTTLWDTLGVHWVSDMWWPEPVYRWVPSHSIFTFPNTIGDFTSYIEGYWDDGDHVAATTGTPIAGFTTSPTEGYAGIVVGNVYQTVLFSFILDEFRYDQDSDGKLDAIELWENAIVYLARGYEHEIVAALEVPKFLEPGDSVLLNATVRNRGLSNETDVELQLLINGTVVDSVLISELLTGASYTLSYLWTPIVEGTYNVTAYAPPLPDEEYTLNNIATKMVRVMVAIRVAVLGDYYSQLTNLLWENGIIAQERDWDVITDIYQYDTVIVNRPYDPGASTFLALIEAADQHRVGLVFTSSWPGSEAPYGISLLQWYLGDPEGQGHTYGQGSVYYEIVQEHPIFEGWNVSDIIYIITIGDRDHAWFWGYSGDTIANIGADYTGIRGGGIACKIRESGNKHLLLAGLAPQYYANTAHWTKEAKLILVRGVLWSSKPVVYEHDLTVSLVVPASLELGETTILNATVRNTGLNNETDVALYLLINGTAVSSATIPELQVNEFYTINYLWTPTETGKYNVTAYAPPVPEEEYTANNVITKKTNVLFFYRRFYFPHEWVGGGIPMGWHADDSSWQYTLPFDFPFYGINYRTIYISSNGLITFIGPDNSYVNSIPALADKLAISPAWDDWTSNEPYDIYIWEDSIHVGIRWNACDAFSSSKIVNFEAILSIDGVIQFNYEHNNGSVSTTIGISNGAGHILAEDVTSLDCINTIVFTPYLLMHDVAVINVKPSKTIVAQGYSVNINVTVANKGYYTETFNVTVYANITSIASQTLTLDSGNVTTLTFTWNTSGFAMDTYTIIAEAEVVEGETYTENNRYTDGVITVSVIRLGDFDGDSDVDEDDTWQFCAYFITYYKSGYKPKMVLFDFDGDFDVDENDLWTFCAAFINYYKST
jgi:thermitase